MNNEHSHLKDKILQEIHSGRASMTPRFYYAFKLAALVLLSSAALLVTIAIFNFISFSIRINHHNELLSFGPRGFQAFLHFFPWPMLVLDVILILLLQWLLRYFREGYKIPILYLIVGVLLCAAALGFALDKTPLNDRLLEHSRELPFPLGELYEGMHRTPVPGSGICRCVVVAINGNTITVRDTRVASSTLKVVVPENDPRATTTALKIGDTIFIAGHEEGGVFEAFGLHREPDGDETPAR
jgi:hypothetical protein